MDDRLGISGQTVGRYLDLLIGLMLVPRLQPWHENVRRASSSRRRPSSGVAAVHVMLDIGSIESLLGHPVVGGRREGFSIETLIAAAPT